jgi:DNA polymerase-1
MKKPLLVLFDGNALVHRAFHALPPLTVSKTGEVVSAVYGFALMLLNWAPSATRPANRVLRP